MSRDGRTGGGNVAYLTLDQKLRWIDERIRAGTWKVGREGLIDISVFRRPESYYLLPVTAHASGGGLLRRDLEPVVVHRAVVLEDLGQILFDQLEQGAASPPLGPPPKRFPVLRVAKASSWRQFVRGAACVDVSCRGHEYFVHPWVRDLSRLDDYQVPAKDGHAHLEHPSAAQLGQALGRACDLVSD